MREEYNIRIILGSRVKEYRTRLSLSQNDLAELSGLNRSYIGDLELGKRNVGIDNVEKLATALGVDPWKLLQQDTDG